MKYREGQVEYYGKKGMSLLGAMEVQWVTHTNAAGETVGGFQYKFTNYIFKGYAGQVNISGTHTISVPYEY